MTTNAYREVEDNVFWCHGRLVNEATEWNSRLACKGIDMVAEAQQLTHSLFTLGKGVFFVLLFLIIFCACLSAALVNPTVAPPETSGSPGASSIQTRSMTRAMREPRV